MKSIINTLFVMVFCCLSYGCASPDSWIGARTSFNADFHNVNESIEFKYAFRYIMPRNERARLEKILANSNYKSSTWTDNMQREGFNALAISAVGINAFSSTGQGIGLGLSVVDSFLSGLSEIPKFNYMVFSDKWLGKHFKSKDDAHKQAIVKTIEALKESVQEFDYQIRCKYNCDNVISTFELISTDQQKYAGIYHPEKLIATLVFRPFEESTELDKKVFTKDSYYISRTWAIILTDPNKDNFTYNETPIPKGYQTSIFHQESFKDVKGFDIYQTVLGRNIAKALSEKLPNWVMADNDSLIEFGVTNGKIYLFGGTGAAKKFHGKPAVK